MASAGERRYESSASTTECSSSSASPSSYSASSFAYRHAISAPKYGTMVPNRIFVGGLSAATTELELLHLFSAYGSVKSTKVISDRAGVSKGYGFVTFESEEEARRLVQQGSVPLFDRSLNIAPAIKKQPFGRVFGANSMTPPTGIHPAPTVYVQNNVPVGFQNGMFCLVPQVAANPISSENESAVIASGGDPVSMMPPSSTGFNTRWMYTGTDSIATPSNTSFSPLYQVGQPPVYIPTGYQYQPVQDLYCLRCKRDYQFCITVARNSQLGLMQQPCKHFPKFTLSKDVLHALYVAWLEAEYDLR